MSDHAAIGHELGPFNSLAFQCILFVFAMRKRKINGIMVSYLLLSIFSIDFSFIGLFLSICGVERRFITCIISMRAVFCVCICKRKRNWVYACCGLCLCFCACARCCMVKFSCLLVCLACLHLLLLLNSNEIEKHLWLRIRNRYRNIVRLFAFCSSKTYDFRSNLDKWVCMAQMNFAV